MSILAKNHLLTDKGANMKKLLSIILLVLAMAMCSIGLVACGENPNDGETGLLTTKYRSDDFYTVTRFIAEDEETVLDLGAEAKEGEVIGRIKKGAFSGNDTIKELIIPDTVTIIDEGAFAGMEALEKITLPFVGKTAVADAYIGETGEGEKSVDGERNFGYVFGTARYDYSTSVTQNYNASETATYYLPLTLKEIKINPASDYTLPAYAFNGIRTINKVIFSDEVVRIGEGAFAGCTTLKTVAYLTDTGVEVGLSSAVTYIGDSAFSGCSALKDKNGEVGFAFNANNAVTKLGKETFKGAGLNVVNLPSNLTEIGVGCFRESAVTKVTTSATKIGASAFNGCQDFVSFNSATDDCIDLTGITDIGNYAFANLNESVTFTVIGSASDSIFWDTNVL